MKKLNRESVIERFNVAHDNLYDYYKFIYVNSKTKGIVICKKHGEFLVAPDNHLHNKTTCPECAMNRRRVGRVENTEIFIRRAKEIHGDFYDYSLVNYKTSNIKVKIICPEHGMFLQRPASHLCCKSKCPKCANKINGINNTYSREKILEKFNIVHNNRYDYSKTNYVNSHTKIIIICKKHGKFTQRPYGHLYGYGCPKCAIRVSQYECLLENYLKKNNITYIAQDRSVISPLELDFYLPDYKLAIECNGLYWHSEKFKKDKDYHLKKTMKCGEKGINLLHILQSEFFGGHNKIISELNNILRINKTEVDANICEVRVISQELMNKFLDKYHLQCSIAADINLGLFYRDRLICAMSIKNNQHNNYELLRCCGNFNFYVKGGPDKLLKYFENEYMPHKIIVKTDRRWRRDTLYRGLGFVCVDVSGPNDWYFKSGKIELHHRNDAIDKCDTNWLKIWDCGNIILEKKYTMSESAKREFFNK